MISFRIHLRYIFLWWFKNYQVDVEAHSGNAVYNVHWTLDKVHNICKNKSIPLFNAIYSRDTNKTKINLNHICYAEQWRKTILCNSLNTPRTPRTFYHYIENVEARNYHCYRIIFSWIRYLVSIYRIIFSWTR